MTRSQIGVGLIIIIIIIVVLVLRFTSSTETQVVAVDNEENNVPIGVNKDVADAVSKPAPSPTPAIIPTPTPVVIDSGIDKKQEEKNTGVVGLGTETKPAAKPIAIFYTNTNYTGTAFPIFDISQEIIVAKRSGVKRNNAGAQGINWLYKSVQTEPGTKLRLKHDAFASSDNHYCFESNYNIANLSQWYSSQADTSAGILGLFMYNKSETASWYYWPSDKWTMKVMPADTNISSTTPGCTNKYYSYFL